MILVPKQLENFINFRVIRENKKISKYGSAEYYDIIIVDYYREFELWGFIKKTESWTKTYKFKRLEKPSDKEGYIIYTSTDEFLILEDQLNNIVSKKWYNISKNNYEYFSKKYPERFV